MKDVNVRNRVEERRLSRWRPVAACDISDVKAHD